MKKLKPRAIKKKIRTFDPAVFVGEDKSFANFRELCKGCGLCLIRCPKKCIIWSKEVGIYKTPAVDCEIEKCIACRICEQICPDMALRIDKFEKTSEKMLTPPERKKLIK